jgi:hypothetical protein
MKIKRIAAAAVVMAAIAVAGPAGRLAGEAGGLVQPNPINWS